jgi:hypothetical protein
METYKNDIFQAKQLTLIEEISKKCSLMAKSNDYKQSTIKKLHLMKNRIQPKFKKIHTEATIKRIYITDDFNELLKIIKKGTYNRFGEYCENLKYIKDYIILIIDYLCDNNNYLNNDELEAFTYVLKNTHIRCHNMELVRYDTLTEELMDECNISNKEPNTTMIADTTGFYYPVIELFNIERYDELLKTTKKTYFLNNYKIKSSIL